MRRLHLLLGLAVLLVACGGDDSQTPAASDPTDPAPTPAAPTADVTEPDAAAGDSEFPTIVDAANGAVEISERPERVVSLSPVATEMLYAVGAGDQVVAAEANSDYPEEGVPVTDLSGFDPNLEAIAAYEPDLVVLSDDANDILAGLERLGVPALHTPAATTLSDTYEQIVQIGAATGHTAAATDLAIDMRAEIDELVSQVPERDTPPTYYHELGPELYTATSDTFVGEIYALAGLENIADAADPDGAAGGYPQLSAEYLVEADPDVVFLADTECCGETAETFAARPGFDQLTAVTEGNVVGLSDDIASRWGPRVTEFLATVVEATADIGVGSRDGGGSP